MGKYNYNKTNWIGGKTVGTADVMNNIENGIGSAHDRLDVVDEQFNTINGVICDVKLFGAKGDGLTNNFDILNNILLLGFKELIFNDGIFFIDGDITLPKGITIRGKNATIKTSSKIILSGDNIISELTFDCMTTNHTINKDVIVSNGTSDNNINNIKILNSTFKNIGSHGVLLNFTNNVKIENCNFYKVGYAGIGCLSCSDVVIDSCLIDTVEGNGIHSYGVYFSSSNDNNVKSTNCSVINSTIKNIPLWEGLDTHGGDNISFINNTVEGCKNSIVATIINSLNPNNIIIKGNKIIGLGSGVGISVGGESNGSSLNHVISDNILINCGNIELESTGAIRVTSNTENVIIINNTLQNTKTGGVILSGNNTKGVVISNNIITGLTGLLSKFGIKLVGVNNECIIKNNFIKADGDKSTNNVRGIQHSSSQTTTCYTNDNVILNCQFEVLGETVTNTTHIKFPNNITLKVGSGEPTHDASVGSLFIRTNGGINTTLYVKEYDGWKGK